MKQQTQQQRKPNKSFLQFIQSFQQLYAIGERLDLSSFNQQSHQQKKVEVIKQEIKIKQSESVQPEAVRKSRRLHQRQKKKQVTSQKPHKNCTSMIKKREKQQKSQQAKQFHRPMLQRLTHPGNPTLRQAKVMFKNNKTYYSIDVKYQEICSMHQISKIKQQASQSIIGQVEQQLRAQRKKCPYCKKAGVYWFSSQQLLKFNNGNFIRRYLESFV